MMIKKNHLDTFYLSNINSHSNAILRQIMNWIDNNDFLVLHGHFETKSTTFTLE